MSVILECEKYVPCRSKIWRHIQDIPGNTFLFRVKFKRLKKIDKWNREVHEGPKKKRRSMVKKGTVPAM